MRPAFTAILSCLLLAATGCAATSAPAPAPAVAHFVVVRHAEKAEEDPREPGDPGLTAAGRQRAAVLAATLSDAPVVAVYATGLRRAQQTVAPIAARHGLAPRTYEARQAAAEFVAGLRRDHAQGTVVVVGHSNTVSGIVSALCTCVVAPIDESDYGNRYEVTIDAGGAVALHHRRD
ncbi:MAG: histidine phosphatase family protein [Pseudomonadota bacterium]|nr:histidine phosphatase family protein [Pseudomonadota bacterium]